MVEDPSRAGGRVLSIILTLLQTLLSLRLELRAKLSQTAVHAEVINLDAILVILNVILVSNLTVRNSVGSLRQILGSFGALVLIAFAVGFFERLAHRGPQIGHFGFVVVLLFGLQLAHDSDFVGLFLTLGHDHLFDGAFKVADQVFDAGSFDVGSFDAVVLSLLSFHALFVFFHFGEFDLFVLRLGVLFLVLLRLHELLELHLLVQRVHQVALNVVERLLDLDGGVDGSLSSLAVFLVVQRLLFLLHNRVRFSGCHLFRAVRD